LAGCTDPASRLLLIGHVGMLHRGPNQEDREGKVSAAFEVHHPALLTPNGHDYGL